MKTFVSYSSRSRAADIVSDLLAGAVPDPSDPPKAFILFAAPDLEHEDILALLGERLPGTVVVGSSSAGEFAGPSFGQGGASALAIGGPDVWVSAVLHKEFSGDADGAARAIAEGFGRNTDCDKAHRAAMIFADALGGGMERLVHHLTVETGSTYKFFGGGAGDNAAFRRTTVFCGREAVDNAVVALEFRSDKPLGLGACHGWKPGSARMRVTEAEGNRVISLDGMPAADVFEDYARRTGQSFDPAAPIGFFLSNILGIVLGEDTLLRVPLAIEADGSLVCAAEVPTGSLVAIMNSNADDAVAAARTAVQVAMEDLGSHAPAGALLFDCVATRLRLGGAAPEEVGAVRAALPGVTLAGCHTHGQIFRGFGQFSGFQNCTAVVCLFPE